MPYRIPRCQVVPLPDHQASFQIEGQERLRWHFGRQYPRPFLYPLAGPSGGSLTRMGHPGDSGHDHHRSVWFAHHDVAGFDFWSDRTKARIRQKRWIAYHDSDREAAMATLMGWYDDERRELMEQELVVAVREAPSNGEEGKGETYIELQSTFRPKAASLKLGKTNFGFLAVRVAKNISAHFGGGKISDSEGRQKEPDIIGRNASWMDYSGPIPGDKTEGVTYFDHPANPTYPSKWHVREDGWMGASVCRDAPRTIRRESPLVLRYLLHVHAGPLDAKRAANIAAEFGHSPAFEVKRATTKHQGYQIRRSGPS